MKIDNKVKQHFNNLLKEGYYFRPQKFDNCTVVQLTKDLNPTGKECTAYRVIKYEMNLKTAQQASEIFGFKITKPTLYFGKAEPIPNGMKRYYTQSETTNLLN